MHLKEKVLAAYEDIKEVYLNDNRPWVVGYSGGKDSTTVVQLIFNALMQLPKDKLHKKIYVISSDTLVETPMIISYIDTNLKLIHESAKKHNIPIESYKVQPQIEDSFWVNLIGKGYPTPRQKFRWCTDRLKIKPANNFVLDRVSEFGEVIMVLGVRKNESASRDQVLANHKVKGRVLHRHTSLQNAYVYTPIEEFTVDDVWNYLISKPSPWGGDNNALLALYQNSSSECPLVVDKTTPSCGNSRFGCWTCTVVKEDKALIGFIESGEEWLVPMLEYRNWLCDIRNDRDRRMKRRMNGSIYYLGEGDERRRGLGPFTLEARMEMLERLLAAQKELAQSGHPMELIIIDELRLIRRKWLEDGDWEDHMPSIYNKYMDKNIIWEYDERPFFEDDEIALLEKLCKENQVDFDLVKKLVQLELSHYGYKYRHSIFKDIGKLLHQDWVHEAAVSKE